MPSHGALTLFFRWRKKSVQKKASGTATPEAARPASHCGQALRYACAWLRASWPSAISGASRPSASLGGGLRPAVAPSGLSSSSVRFAHPPGKSPLLPIFERGSSQCRAQHIRTANIYVRARSCSLFSSFKKGKAFSLRCLSPLCFPADGAGQAQPMRVGMLRRKLGGFAASISRPLFQLTAGGGLIQPALLGMLRYGWDGFAVQKTGFLFSSAVGAILAQPAQLGIILCSLDIFVT